MVVGHIRTLMKGSRTSVPIFPKIAFRGGCRHHRARSHLAVGGEAYGQVLLRDFVMEIRDHKLVAGWRIRICKTPRACWGPVVDPDVVIGRTRLMTWAVGKMKRFVELIAEIYFGRELCCRLERCHECKCKRDVENNEGCNRMRQ